MSLAEGASMAMGADCGILECSGRALGREALEQRRVGKKLFAATMELAHPAQYDFRVGVEWPHDPADSYLLITIPA